MLIIISKRFRRNPLLILDSLQISFASRSLLININTDKIADYRLDEKLVV